MSLFGRLERLLEKMNRAIDYHSERDFYQRTAEELDACIEAATTARGLAIAEGAPEDLIAEATWQLDILTASKYFNALLLKRAPDEELTEHAGRIKALQQGYFDWCSEAHDLHRRLGRYQRFWDHYHQNEDDGRLFHGDFIRTCAYRLARLYAETGDLAECQDMLQWLEDND